MKVWWRLFLPQLVSVECWLIYVDDSLSFLNKMTFLLIRSIDDVFVKREAQENCDEKMSEEKRRAKESDVGLRHRDRRKASLSSFYGLRTLNRKALTLFSLFLVLVSLFIFNWLLCNLSFIIRAFYKTRLIVTALVDLSSTYP